MCLCVGVVSIFAPVYNCICCSHYYVLFHKSTVVSMSYRHILSIHNFAVRCCQVVLSFVSYYYIICSNQTPRIVPFVAVSALSLSFMCVCVRVCLWSQQFASKKVFMFHDLPVRMVPEDGSSTTLTTLFQNFVLSPPQTFIVLEGSCFSSRLHIVPRFISRFIFAYSLYTLFNNVINIYKTNNIL